MSNDFAMLMEEKVMLEQRVIALQKELANFKRNIAAAAAVDEAVYTQGARA